MLLPGTAWWMRSKPAPARALIQAGVAVAVATDANPGTCNTESLPAAAAHACLDSGMTAEEALTARRKEVPEGAWITSMGGWIPHQWTERRHPTLAELGLECFAQNLECVVVMSIAKAADAFGGERRQRWIFHRSRQGSTDAPGQSAPGRRSDAVGRPALAGRLCQRGALARPCNGAGH